MSDEGAERHDGLEIQEDLAHTRRQWRAQAVTGALTVLVLLLALLGLFGTGPLSWATATGDAGLLEVDYERFLRHTGHAELQVHVEAQAARGGTFEIVIDRDYLDRFQVTSVTPQPDSVEALAGRVQFTFLAGSPAADLDVSFAVRPQGLWRQHGEVLVPGQDSVRFWQLTLP